MMDNPLAPLAAPGLEPLPSHQAPLELLFYVNQALQPQGDPAVVRQQWRDLVDEARALVGHEADLHLRWRLLWQLFYRQWGFKAATEHYFSVDSSLLEQILTHRCGNAASMAIILQALCEALEIDCYVIDFPGQLLLGLPSVGVNYLDPLTGTHWGRTQLELRVRGHLGNLATLSKEHLTGASANVCKQRYLDCLKQACLLQEAFSEGLICSDLLLQLTPGDPQQILERGFILQQLDYYQGAAADFSFFVEHCPDHPNAELLKLQISALEEHHTIFH